MDRQTPTYDQGSGAANTRKDRHIEEIDMKERRIGLKEQKRSRRINKMKGQEEEDEEEVEEEEEEEVAEEVEDEEEVEEEDEEEVEEEDEEEVEEEEKGYEQRKEHPVVK